MKKVVSFFKPTLSPAKLLMLSFSLFLAWWYRDYFTSASVPSVDLPSFMSGVEKLRWQSLYGRLSFYDRSGFCGWAPFLLYGVIPSLFVSVVSYGAELFSGQSVRLATHCSLVFGVALFPWAFLYAMTPFGREIVGADRSQSRSMEFVRALSAIVFSFWFLNHDRQWYGIGAASPMNIGLFAQLFAWLFMLMYLGALLRIIAAGTCGKRDGKILALSLGLLIPTHMLSAVFCLFIGGLSLLWFREARVSLLKAHILGFGVSAFWFFPFIAFVGDIAPLDIHRPTGDILELFFRYPLWGMVQTLKTWFATGELSAFNPINVLLPLLTVILFSHRAIPQAGLLKSFFLFCLCAFVFFNSGFVATSLQVGFHYYRFMAYVFLLCTVLFASLPLVLFSNDHCRWKYLLFVTLSLGCFVSTVSLPHYEREMIRKKAHQDYLSEEDQVVDFFENREEKGRVYVEYFNDYKKYAQLSAHYIVSQLVRRTGFEALPNSHLQEAPAYRMIAASAQMLGANTYHVPLLYTDGAELSDKVLVQQLRDFGITHVIAGTKKFQERLEPFAKAVTKRGKYWIVTLSDEALAKITPLGKKILLGYRDENGTAPFRMVQYYFFSRQGLYRHFDLVDLNNHGVIPGQVRAILVNGRDDTHADKFEIRMNYKPEYRLDHYSPHYPHNVEVDQYQAIERFLEEKFHLREQLKALKRIKSEQKDMVRPQFEWQSGDQEISLKGLRPFGLYELNYTYFDLWRAKGATLYRGMGEKIFLSPSRDEVTLSFSRWYSPSAWLGLLVSLFSVVILGRARGGKNGSSEKLSS
ncbi:MAG: hypothetical protein KDD64_05570 [Bdellovibrionales bacterium]|nr:hypothetical protein [Bdellovibrionales bacterium]